MRDIALIAVAVWLTFCLCWLHYVILSLSYKISPKRTYRVAATLVVFGLIWLPLLLYR